MLSHNAGDRVQISHNIL